MMVEVRWRVIGGERWLTTTHDLTSFKAGSSRDQIRERILRQAEPAFGELDMWVAHDIDEAVELIWADCNCRAGARAAAERDARRQTRKARIRAHARHKNG